MYILKTKSKQNVFIKDLGIIVSHEDKNGVLVNNLLFEMSKDAQKVKDKLIIEKQEGDYSQLPEKNVLETELELENIKDPKENMVVLIRNINETGQPASAMYIEGEWKVMAGGGSGGECGYIHPQTHPASMIVEDETKNFVSQVQIEKWDNKAEAEHDHEVIVDWDEIQNKPEIPELPELASVATTGSYNDLKDKPEIPELPELAKVAISGKYGDLLEAPELSKVSITGSYNDLLDKPEMPEMPELADVAFSGDFNDLLNIPEVPELPELAKVATSGDFNDLLNIPEAPELADVATTGDFNDLLNKPELANVAISGKYEDLLEVPAIPTKVSELELDNVYTKEEIYTKEETEELLANIGSGDCNYVHPETHPAEMIVEDETRRFVTDLQVEGWNNKAEVDHVHEIKYEDLLDKPVIPTKASELELDVVYTVEQTDEKVLSIINDLEVSETTAYSSAKVQEILAEVGEGSGYIHPETHEASMIVEDETRRFVTDLQIEKWNNKAEADHGHEIVVDWNEIQNKPEIPEIPELASVATSGDFNDLLNKPVIPTKASELELDVVYTVEQTDEKVLSMIDDLEVSETTAYSSAKVQEMLANVGEGGNYIHPETHPAEMIVEDENRRFVTDLQIEKWNNKAEADHGHEAKDIVGLPTVPTKTSELELDNVYSRVEVDELIDLVSEGGGSGSGGASGPAIIRYAAEGIANNQCMVKATGSGVTASKIGNQVILSVPEDVQLMSTLIYFSPSDMTGTSVVVDLGLKSNSYYDANFDIPAVTAVQDRDGQRGPVARPYINYDRGPGILEMTGLVTNLGIWLKLNF